MNKINGKNLEALKAYYGVKPKQTEKEEKKEDVEAVKEFETRKVEASALDAAAAQIWGAQLSKVDKSDDATEKRIEQAFANSPFMAALNEFQGIEEDFVAFAMANVVGVNHEKLANHMKKPLSEETAIGVAAYMNTLTA